jgi:hypothetical protein
MVMYPPVVSVAGFANVDRGMFRAVSNLTKELECCKKQVRFILSVFLLMDGQKLGVLETA